MKNALNTPSIRRMTDAPNNELTPGELKFILWDSDPIQITYASKEAMASTYQSTDDDLLKLILERQPRSPKTTSDIEIQLEAAQRETAIGRSAMVRCAGPPVLFVMAGRTKLDAKNKTIKSLRRKSKNGKVFHGSTPILAQILIPVSDRARAITSYHLEILIENHRGHRIDVDRQRPFRQWQGESRPSY